jgi:shikimate kinase / 3-dehydroquinate synthase
MIFLYGPPGSGKSSVGSVIADSLSLPFIDLDVLIENMHGKLIPVIFQEEGETGFRAKERNAFYDCLRKGNGVIALGGGALLEDELREQAYKAGSIICFNASFETLLNRLSKSSTTRPLIADPYQSQEIMLKALLEKRADHYASFVNKIDTSNLSVDEIAFQALIQAGKFRIRGMGPDYDVRVISDGIKYLGENMVRRNLHGHVAVVCDRIVAKWHLEPVLESLRKENLRVDVCLIPSGEIHKNMDTIIGLWNSFVKDGIDRTSTIIALGGGVVNDLAGFAAATYMRGVQWVAVPTTLLSMIDASLGGKTGADLPAGKNMIGAFHSPRLVLADPTVLKTLSQEEFISGLAEIIKHGIIADPVLFDKCQTGFNKIYTDLENVVKRAIAVKVRVIQEDPYEKGKRAVLNLGHTLGHAIERVTDYQVRHGEAVGIGMVAAAKVSEFLGIGESGISDIIRSALSKNNLPTVLPDRIDKNELQKVIMLDKKRSLGVPRLALPKRIGEAVWGIELTDPSLLTDL